MQRLEAVVAATIDRHELLTRHQTIIVALSGGADSVALLRAACALGYRVEALHCNFALRGKESEADEVFVRELCGRLCVPLRVQRFDTRLYAQEAKASIEMAARELRYGWFSSVLAEDSESVVAVAHNADDQIETMLLNLSMGTGLRGLSGMPYKRHDKVVRPLMDCTRGEVEAYLQALGQDYREDSSNSELIYKRNVIRHRLIPLLEELNPSFRLGARRTIDHLRGAEALYLDAVARERQRIAPYPDRLHIPSLLSSPHPATLLYELLTPYGFSSVQCASIAGRLACLSSGGRYFSSHYGLVRGGEYLELYPLDEKPFEGCTIDVSRDGQVCLPMGVLHWRIVKASVRSPLKCAAHEALFDWGRVVAQSSNLCIRSRSSGDKLYPFGLKGSKLLRRIFIDGGFSHRERAEALLLTLDNDILWLIGRVADRRYAVSSESEQVLAFSLEYKP